ncbi:glycerol-3-phosphate dehydrogenase subunit GlpB [Mobiluncus sp.]|uniref:glycerol-3-phosphate dehydrogenase subunit GlpB n=1 Tax=Mobiluncus sp. TaxID=47293 RepID=UPI002A91339D|nr:glycerol-3-phosphate dehydrogenase subunit GlpB [Mobiluncus sp.]MDY6077112.1 glycerol-3-phosphate dehydrogenase subunit GlpB [Mobiluncus sp.]
MKIAVIGEGLAGLSAALMAHAAGHQVTVYTKGMGGLALSNGTADVFGYAPDAKEPVTTDPFAEIEKLPENHPYHTIGVENVRGGIDWYRDTLADFWEPVKDGAGNVLLATAIGSPRPTFLIPRSCAAGVLRKGMKLLVVGVKQFKDFPAAMIADNLSRCETLKLSARSVTLDFSGREKEADVTATDYARAFDVAELDPDKAAKMRSNFVALINGIVADGETVLIPAFMGLSEDTFADFAAQVHAPVAEVPTVPPSILGRRIFDHLVRRCRAERVDIHLNCEVLEAHTMAEHVESLTVKRAGGADEVRVDAVLDAAGGIMSGNLERDSHLLITEKIFGLPIFAPESVATTGIHEIDVENRQDVENALMSGVHVNAQMQPVDEFGKAVFDNVFCLGEMIGGAAPWRELSGEGLALGSAYAAAKALGSAERSEK